MITTVSLLASALMSAVAPATYPATIAVSRDGGPFSTFHTVLTSEQTACDSSGWDDDLTTVRLTPMARQDGTTVFHLALERARVIHGAKSVMKASSDFALAEDYGVYRVKLPARAGEGATEVRIALGESGSDAAAVALRK